MFHLSPGQRPFGRVPGIVPAEVEENLKLVAASGCSLIVCLILQKHLTCSRILQVSSDEDGRQSEVQISAIP